jgi:hypothetical protein
MCGHVYPITARKVKHVDGDLVVTRREGDPETETIEGMMQKKFRVLTSVARKRGYNNPTQWAFNVICGQEASRLAKKVGMRDAQTTNGLTAEERASIWKMTMGTKQSSIR